MSPTSATPPQPRPCHCVWLPATANVHAALPDPRAGARERPPPRRNVVIGKIWSSCGPETTCSTSPSAATITCAGLSLLCSRSTPAATSPLAIRQRVAVRPYTQPIPSRVRSTRPRPSAAITTVQISQRRRWAAHDVTAKQGALAAYRRALRNPAAPRLLITADPRSQD